MTTDTKRIQALARRNDKAANEMLVALTAGALAGNADPDGSMSGHGAANTAAEALERILTITEVEDEPDTDDGDDT